MVIIGAGAAGLMAARAAGKRGRRTLIIEHTGNIAEKIRISGGGRCNFTNLHTTPAHFISANPHFATSALKRFTPTDFIALLVAHGIPYHEKTLGQLFCDNSATDIIDMLIAECNEGDVEIKTNTTVTALDKTAAGFTLNTTAGIITAASIIIATGGLSIPKIGASSFGYDIARQFNIPVIETRAALVPAPARSSRQASGLSAPVASTAALRSSMRLARTPASVTNRDGPSEIFSRISRPRCAPISSPPLK